MSKKLALIIPTGIMATLLTVAPIIAQQTQDTDARDTPATSRVDSDNDGFDMGWLGLLGLLGLTGLIRRDHNNHSVADRNVHR